MRPSSRHQRTLPQRRWPSYLLLVLYIAAAHGLPALHLAAHKNDHVHELGGLRWLNSRLPQPAHVHGHAHATEQDGPAPSPIVIADDTARNAQSHWRASDERPALQPTPHLALGSAHAQQSLLTPAMQITMAVVRGTRTDFLDPSAPTTRKFVAAQRARAPPRSV